MSNERLIIDVRIGGYQGEPTRLVATLDTDTGSLYISNEKSYIPPKLIDPIAILKNIKNRKRTIIVTDMKDTFSDWNMLYIESEHLLQVIRAYHEKERGKLLKIADTVAGRFNPDNVLQQDKLDAKTGSVWSMSEEAENGHMCILVACWAAMKSSSTFMFTKQLHEDKDYSSDPNSDFMDEPFSI